MIETEMLEEKAQMLDHGSVVNHVLCVKTLNCHDVYFDKFEFFF